MLGRLIAHGATVIVIEHHLDMIAQADWLIDMGPDAGQRGGRVMFEGTVANIISEGTGDTAAHLRLHCGSSVQLGA